MSRFTTRLTAQRRGLGLGFAGLLFVAAGTVAAQSGDYTADIDSGGLLELELESGATVEIRAGGGGQVRVHSEVGADSDPVKIEVTETSGGVLVSCKPAERRRSHRSDVHLTLEVPQRIDIALDSTGGSVTIDGVEGEIRGSTMGGGLSLSNLRGVLNLSTMGGDIKLVDSDVDGKVSTMGGKVLLRDVVGDVDGSSMGGNVRLENVARRGGRSTGDAVIISTMGGRVDVDEAPAGAQLKTMGGDVHVKRAEQYVKATTMGGDIRVDEIAGWIEATTMGGDVEVHVVAGGAGDYHVELESMSGEILLTLPSGIGFRFEVGIEYTKNRDGKYRIESDFPLQIEEDSEWSTSRRHGGDPRKEISGTGRVGDGAHLVKVNTVNGNITIRQQ